MKKKISYREFFESCGLDDDQVEMACAMFDAVKGRALDGVGMGQVDVREER